MQMETPITTTTLSLEISDIYKYISSLNDKISQLSSKNVFLQNQLNSSLQNPPSSSSSYSFSINDISSHFEDLNASLINDKIALQNQLRDVQSQLNEQSLQNKSLTDSLSSEITQIASKIQRLEIITQSLLNIPEILIKNESNQNNSNVLNGNENSLTSNAGKTLSTMSGSG